MVTNVGSSNLKQGCLHFTVLGKGMNPAVLPLTIGK